MKKVMLITPMLHQGGFERICVMTARLLKEKYEVVIVVFSMEDIAFDVSGLQVIDLNLKARQGKLFKIINVLLRSFKLTRLQKKLKTDISYSFGMTANIANALTYGAKRKLSACHSFEEIKNKRYMNLICRHSDAVLCCSKKMTEQAEALYSFSNVSTLWNPYDIDGIREQSMDMEAEDLSFWETEDKVLVSMGREDEVKGFWHLLKVFQAVHEKNKETRLAIIGDGEFTAYKKLAEELGIKDKVLFTGLKKNPFPYLKESDVYVLTSISEGLPNALVEAMALSLPIVSVNCLSGPAEILHRNWQSAEKKGDVFQADFGILTPALTSEPDFRVVWEEENKKVKLEQGEEKLAEAILEMLEKEELSKHFREAAAVRAEDFSKENYLQGLIFCMENIGNDKEKNPVSYQ